MEQMEIIILDTDIRIDYFRGVEVAKDSIQKGLGLPDALIAAVTISADGKLITGNKKHFEFIEGLKVDLPSYRRYILEE
ncbi:hypothetical protein C4E22_06505 [ANME-1 cluster archaeon AG-394-G06]|nr:hypothetical protein [ANME-1 cluster archaeon AG-394-G06]